MLVVANVPSLNTYNSELLRPECKVPMAGETDVERLEMLLPNGPGHAVVRLGVLLPYRTGYLILLAVHLFRQALRFHCGLPR